MTAFQYLHDEIAIVGWSCRVPGASSTTELWSMLREGRCAVSRIPPDRWSLERFGHPRKNEPGKSYTWAAGVIDGIWDFDPAVFGISPREAAKMDPQQRVLLELTWEALEDAGIPPSSIAGSEAGVYVGGSAFDYGMVRSFDPGGTDSYCATGTALAILANRISYVFDLHGPSFTVDTACSSSLVALHQAVDALRAGRVDTAIVGGINILGSPFSFIDFAQASMLSSTGLCQAFSAAADGYVRAEGGVVFVLQKLTSARSGKRPLHGLILASDVNSDGRTQGIALPSVDAQAALLDRVYSRAGIDANRLAFIEAHGTGTPVGDPIEATAIGRTLGRSRSEPLLIGSIKTNIGHLEPASGLAGVMKAVMALNAKLLPASLHFNEPNPNIDFDQLNLVHATGATELPAATLPCAGVNSFGFGGTNAHVIVAPARPPQRPAPERSSDNSTMFAISAQSKPALAALAKSFADRFAGVSDNHAPAVIGAVAHRRDQLAQRLAVVAGDRQGIVGALEAFAKGEDDPRVTVGTALGRRLPVAYIYSGNGSQYAGMGLSAYYHNEHFRAHFERIDDLFRPLAGWSLREALLSDGLAKELKLTSVAQPLIFAIQSASTAVLHRCGIRPTAVLGHSVGEVAAAEAAGILDLDSAVRVIHYRSTHQELVRNAGRMAVVVASLEGAQELTEAIPGLEIAAYNSPRAVTVVGPTEAVAKLAALTKRERIVFRELDLDYPFHSALMAPVEEPLIAGLQDLVPCESTTSFVSTVTGSLLSGAALDATYWWRNVREPVRFLTGLQHAARLGARCFVEIGPRGTLLNHVIDTLDRAGPVATVSVLDRNEQAADPFRQAVANVYVRGGAVDDKVVFGADPGPHISLPTYPWQRQAFPMVETQEALGAPARIERHPLIGGRATADSLEWHSQIDTVLMPQLADHRVGGRVVLPGAALAEMAIAAARLWLQTDNVSISQLDILQFLDLSEGEAREVQTRVSPGSSTVEILSRPRLTGAAWSVHAKGKIAHGDPQSAHAFPETATGRTIRGDAIYRMAAGAGLNYGPHFRLLQSVTQVDDRRILVELAAPEAVSPRYSVDPASLDCCFHGLFVLFDALKTKARGVGYVPVRFDEVALARPGVLPRRASIELSICNDRSIVADFRLFDEENRYIGMVRGARFTAVRTRQIGDLESIALVQRPQLVDGLTTRGSGVPLSASDLVAHARSLGMLALDDSKPREDAMLLEGWATTVAYELAAGIAKERRLSLDTLVAGGRIPAELRLWMHNILLSLEASGLAKVSEGHWVLTEDPMLPDSVSVLATLATEHPARAAELLLAGEVTHLVKHLVANETNFTPPSLSTSAVEFYQLVGLSARDGSEMLSRLLQRNGKSVWPTDRALRVLQVGYGPLTMAARQLAEANEARLTVLEPERRRYEQAKLSMPRGSNVEVIDGKQPLAGANFDLVIAAQELHRLPEGIALSQLAQALAPGGLMVAIEPQPSLFRDLIFGLDPAWFRASVADFPLGALRSSVRWKAEMEEAGFTGVRVEDARSGCESALLVTGQIAPRPETPAGESRTALIVSHAKRREAEVATTLATLLPAAGIHVSLNLTEDDATPRVDDAVPPIVIHFMSSADDSAGTARALRDRCLQLKVSAERLGGAQTALWLVFFGALTGNGTKIRPAESAAWAFSRTLANEYPNIDVRRVDVAPHATPQAAAEAIRDLIASGTKETELIVAGDSVRAIRVAGIERASQNVSNPPAEAARLERSSTSGQRVSWVPAERAAPAEGEVEIAVEATGLNFRDLMWSMSLLPDDMLEDGFAGPSLGLECAGQVVRVGAGVAKFKVGDSVVALAPSAFSTHVTVPAAAVSKVPDGLSCEAAATIPVAFLTAYYSLMILAKLKRGEWVLIHGGAGGVGLAAIQIAHYRGARVIATAGSGAKRDLLTALGVAHVLDSRSTAFAHEVRDLTGGGVDVVLNSLAGEAMEKGVACLRPFGRFVELGKRDYVANTHIGLRPFRKNLSYFGVDVDQLMGGQRRLGQKVYSEIMRLFKGGALSPLPYRVFESTEVADAFRLMQQSGHIGKIVVRPPAPGVVRRSTRTFAVDPRRTHLITGGFGGFGLETARWLVDHGARHIALVGRQGAATPEAQSVVAELTASGVQVLAQPCDVTDRRAVQKLFETIQRTMPPLAGVIHGAMVLDDTLISNLDADRLDRVLEPKVTGAENLDRATRGASLDYFVLFSSVTTLIGNPGQANYVAANGYMEGLARRRRQEGLPGLAIGWGPISDVGVVARNQRLATSLKQRGGVKGMSAREALDLMAEALSQPAQTVDDAVVTIALQDWAATSDRLALLRSPTYAAFHTGDRAASTGGRGSIDLRALVAEGDIENARRKVIGVIVEEIARVLHLPSDDISQVRPLGEIGLDSLMGLELAMGLQDRFGLDIPLSASTSNMTVNAVADQVIAQASSNTARSVAPATYALAETHMGGVIAQTDVEQMQAVRDMVEAKSKELKRMFD